jgi:hypothetical protein
MSSEMLSAVVSTDSGSIMLVQNKPHTNFAQDVYTALQKMGALDITNVRDPQDVELLIREERISRGLREEAGIATGSMSVGFFNSRERLATGVVVLSTLRLQHLPKYGDCIMWVIGVINNDGGYTSISCSTKTEVDATMALLRLAANGPSLEVSSSPTPIPSAADLAKLG